MKIVYICNEINLKSGWGVLNYHTIINATKKFSEIIVFTSLSATNLDLSKYENVKIFPILQSINDSLYKIAIIQMDKFKIKQKIDIKKIDLVHILVEPFLPLVSIFKNSKKVFTIVGTYSDYPFRIGVNRFLYKRSLSYVNSITSISEYTKSRFNNIYNHNIEVITLGVDFNNFSFKEKIYEKERAFVFVGHIKARKGLIYALKAFKKIVDEDKGIKFYIVGAQSTSNYVDECFKYIKDNNLSQVVFLGKVDDAELIKIYKKSICNILPSINDNNSFEGFGLIHLEANACGIPSIGSLESGNESAIVNEKTGYLCKQKDIDDIENKMRIIIEDFDSGNFNNWQDNCIEYAKGHDWKNYFSILNDMVYK